MCPLEKTYDAEKGFKKAAENTEYKQLESFLKQGGTTI
tara:strand:- start:587 stop:700 length:114 start_codon:yes stop_codon:yes gene_type:complete